jgi:hypothetical protein
VAQRSGSDGSGDGSMTHPYASMRRALTQVTAAQQDIYLRARAGGATYDESGASLVLPSGTSLYVGYGPAWVRDTSALKSALNTNAAGIDYSSLHDDTWVSGLSIHAAGSASADQDVTGIRAVGDLSAR